MVQVYSCTTYHTQYKYFSWVNPKASDSPAQTWKACHHQRRTPLFKVPSNSTCLLFPVGFPDFAFAGGTSIWDGHPREVNCAPAPSFERLPGFAECKSRKRPPIHTEHAAVLIAPVDIPHTTFLDQRCDGAAESTAWSGIYGASKWATNIDQHRLMHALLVWLRV